MRLSGVSVLFVSAVFFTGCSGSPVATTIQTSASSPGATITGKVHGGQNPISGAHVYLYAVNTTGYGGPGIAASSSNASISLLTSSTGNPADGNGNYYVTTASDGGFTITGDYTCPSTASPVYIYAIGGNSGSGANSAAGLLAGISSGNCPASGTISSSTNVIVNELSTIATAYAFAGFATDATHISSSGTTKALAGITHASDTVETLVNVLSNGAARLGLPSGTGTVPQSEIDTLGNILAACVNSNGAVTGPTNPTPCYTLFTDAMNGSTAPTDTATATINIAHNPGANIIGATGLFSLQTASAPFVPDLSAAPNDFTIAVNQTSGGLNVPFGVAVDGPGNIWVANNGADTISEFNGNGAPMSDSPISGGGLGGPYLLAVDSNNLIWVGDNNSGNLSLFEESGAAVFSSGFGDLSGPAGIAIDTSGYAWVANSCNNSCSPINSISVFTDTGSELSSTAGYDPGSQLNEPAGVAIDISGNVWVTNHGADSISELSSSGTGQSGSPFSGGGLSAPAGIAIDASGDIWTSNTDNSLSAYDPGTGTFLSGASGGGLASPIGIAIDGAGNIWAANNGTSLLANNGTTISEFNSSGSAITSSTGYQGGLSGPIWIAIDSSGNVWVTNAGNNSITKFVGAAVPVATPIVANLLTTLGYGAHAVNKP